MSALERHRLRCRFRSRSRKKACAECSRSKVRCDQGVPACSRCTVHALSCVYPQARGEDTNKILLRADDHGAQPGPLPLTPASDFSQSHSAFHIGGQAPLTDLGPSFPSPRWVPDEESWQDEALSLFDIPYDHGGSQEPQDTPALSLTLDVEPTQPPNGTGFQRLSAYLADRMNSIEQGLDNINRACKSNVDGLATASGRALFIHFMAWKPARRSAVLAEAEAIAPLYAAGTPQSQSLLIRAIDAQLARIQLEVLSEPLAKPL